MAKKNIVAKDKKEENMIKAVRKIEDTGKTIQKKSRESIVKAKKWVKENPKKAHAIAATAIASVLVGLGFLLGKKKQKTEENKETEKKQ